VKSDEPLALHGGPAAFPAGPPTWPLADPDVESALREAHADGSWGRYHGPHTELLRERLAVAHNTPWVTLCCSGTLAVELALRGLRVGAGDEVILAAYDFPGNFRCVEAVGAMPVLVDIDPRTWCLDAGELDAAISERTRAVVVSHLHGGLADMPAVCEFAAAHGIAVVEDACQAPGAMLAGRPAGSWGNVGVLSFGGSKLLTAGRGGALLTGDESVQQRIRVFQQRGNDAFPLSELQAAVLIPQLAKLADRNRIRAASAERLIQQLEHISTLGGRGSCRAETLVEGGSAGTSPSQESVSKQPRGDFPQLQPVQLPDQGQASYYKLAVLLSDTAPARDTFLAAAQAEGLAVGEGFRGFASRSPRRCRKVGNLRHAHAASEHTVLLHHPILLEAEQIRLVAATFTKLLEALRGME